MENELTEKIQELFQKWQAWVDAERFIPKKFRNSSQSEKFAEKIMNELEEEMVRQKFSLENTKTYLPNKYLIFISEADNVEFTGKKRELFIEELNKFVERYFILFSLDFKSNKFVELQSSSELKLGEVKIIHQWEETFTPNISFANQTKTVDFEDFNEEDSPTVLSRNFFEKPNDDWETVVRKNLQKFYGLEIWREGIKQHSLPIFQPEIVFGRGSTANRVDIQLKDDLEISRHHAILTFQNAETFSLLVTGRNPAFIDETPIYSGQTVTFNKTSKFQIGSYLMTLQV